MTARMMLGLGLGLVAGATLAEAQCRPPVINPNDTRANWQLTYRSTSQGTLPGEGARTLTDVKGHTVSFQLGYDMQGRLVASQAIPDAMRGDGPGSFGRIRAVHSVRNQVFTEDDICAYLGASPTNEVSGNPLGSLPYEGSIQRGLIQRSEADLRLLGGVLRVAARQLQFNTCGDNGGNAKQIDNTGIYYSICYTYRQSGTEYVLEKAEIRTSTESMARDGGLTRFSNRTEYGFAGVNTIVPDQAREDRRMNSSPPPIEIGLAGNPGSSRVLRVPSTTTARTTAARRSHSDGGRQNVVFQHGFLSSGASWSRMDPWLSNEFLFGTKLRPDLPSTARLETQRDALIQRLREAGGKDWILIGHSNGGLVSRSAAQKVPALVRGVITNSTLHQGALIVDSIQELGSAGIEALAGRAYSGCGGPTQDPVCFLAYFLQRGPFSDILRALTQTAALPVTRDMGPSSPFIRDLNRMDEPFVRVSIQNVADPRWVAFRVVGDALCDPDSNCGGRAWARYAQNVYVALRTCTPLAITLGFIDPQNFFFYQRVAAMCSHLAGILDSIDNYWNGFYAYYSGGDGIVDSRAQIWPGALTVSIRNADAHTGVIKSDKVRDQTIAVLDQQFQVPRRSSPVVVSAASFSRDAVAPGSRITIFGSDLAVRAEQASSEPLPTVLGGTRVEFRDETGRARDAELLYVSKDQINAAVPSDLELGPVTFQVRSENGTTRSGIASLGKVAPGLFSADGSGSGIASGYALRARPGRAVATEEIARRDPGTGALIPIPIDLGNPEEQVYLVLYGTGMRGRSGLQNVVVQIGELAIPVEYAGAGGAALDQINLRLPRELAGRGEVRVLVSVDGRAANVVQLTIK